MRIGNYAGDSHMLLLFSEQISAEIDLTSNESYSAKEAGSGSFKCFSWWRIHTILNHPAQAELRGAWILSSPYEWALSRHFWQIPIR